MRIIRNSEYGNMIKGVLILAAVMLLVIGCLSQTAYMTGAGDAAYTFSLLFVIAQSAVIISCYISWYRKVNRLAADLYNITEMRKTAHSKVPAYLILSLFLTCLIAGLAVLATLLNIIFVGISHVYCFSSAFSEFLAGNITLFILMLWFGLPNRVLGRY